MLNRHNLEIATLVKHAKGRYGLDKIKIEPSKTTVTDGSFAVTVTAPPMSVDNFPELEGVDGMTDNFQPFTATTEEAQEAVKSHPVGRRSCPMPILACTAVAVDDNGGAALVSTDLENKSVTKIAKQDLPFPDVERCMPSDDAALISIKLDAKLLAPILQAAVKFQDDKRGQCDVTLRVYDLHGQRQISIKTSNQHGQRFHAVLCPMSSEFEEVYEKQHRKIGERVA